MQAGENELKAAAQAYLEAFEARDLPSCLSFYADDATLLFQTALYKGREALETWHKERFSADLHLVRLERMTVEHDRIVIEAVGTSNRLRAWKIASISGRVTLSFEGGKIREARFAARMGPLEML